MNLKLNSPIKSVKGVGEIYFQIFNKNGISTVLDLLLHFPMYYINFSHVKNIIEKEKKNLYLVKIINYTLMRNYRRRLSILKVNAKLNQNNIKILFFNKPYLVDFFKQNNQVYIYGIFEIKGSTYQLRNPLIFTCENKHTVFSVYSNISKIKSGKIRKLVENIFKHLNDDFEPLPEIILRNHSFPKTIEALRNIHFPEKYDLDEINNKKNRFIYIEFLFFQLELQHIRSFFKKVKRINNYTINNKLRESIKSNLKFELTQDQIKAYEEIVNDLKDKFTMQRLLQGDVGTGKTIIAFLSILIDIKNGFQGAFLAPTEILAYQHFTKAKKFFVNSKIEILTGSTSNRDRKKIQEKLKSGKIDILFGTHSILNEHIKFKNLSLIVIDEQHRFGVSQRASLYYKGKAVDLLVTTATPIPRTMLLSLYNDLSISTIKTKPHGRKPNITSIIDVNKRDEFYSELKNKIEGGRKAYIVLPLIEDSDFFSELKSIESESEYYKKNFKDLPIGIVSGRAPGHIKNSILNDFASGSIRILISTTVIEIGIDVKDASIIVIENADRYGLSQLHQLRGRVGRGEIQSYCYLISSANATENGKLRLKTLESTNDGFEISEIDLKMRGGGIISGLEQSGYLDFKVGDIKRDFSIFKSAQKDAGMILDDYSLHNDHITNLLNETKNKIKDISFS